VPKYSWKINDLVFEEDSLAMFKLAGSIYERCLIAVLWVSGARTEEVLQLTTESVQYDSFKVDIKFNTLKLGGGAFAVQERTLSFKRPSGLDQNLYLETILTHIRTLPKEARLFPYTSRWAEKVINRLGERALRKRLAPYHFRHSVLSHLAAQGANVPELMHFKGAKDAKSVSTYLHARPYIVDLSNQRRARHQKADQGGRTSPNKVVGV
jgi:site-specific recombinase XerD